MNRLRTTTCLALAALMAFASHTQLLSAQNPTPAVGRHPLATRGELEALAQQAEQEASQANNVKLREEKQAEATGLRARLRDGDFPVGERLVVTVDSAGIPVTDSLVVRAGQMVTIRGLGDVSLHGVLHSEVQDYLRQQVGRFVKDANVRATPLIRIAIEGPVGKPGFYALPADILVSDAIMTAGGPTGNANLETTTIRRASHVLWNKGAVRNAIRLGATLDQLHLRAGDEIVVGDQSGANWGTVLQAASIALGLGWTVLRITGH